MLLYATGGLAYASVDHTLGLTTASAVGYPGVAVLATVRHFLAVQTSDTKAGWTVGGGAELLRDSHWVLRAEALYVDLGSETTYLMQLIPAASLTPDAVGKWDDNVLGSRASALPINSTHQDCCAAPLK